MMRCVLAAVDATDDAPYVVREATELAKRFGGVLILFRAIHELNGQADDASAELERLGAFARTLGVTTTVRVVTSEDSASAVVAAAEDVKADAVVIGGGGYSLVTEMLRTQSRPTLVVV